jgi:hypothetical protein
MVIVVLMRGSMSIFVALVVSIGRIVDFGKQEND